jgi:ABC-type glycerol-3-phosphate transport system substrate-binding protein
VDGKIYAIPSSTRDYYGGYFLFHKKYFSKEDIKDFDGTLQGVAKLVEEKGIQKAGSIYFESLTPETIFPVPGMEGYGRYGLYFPDDGSDVELWFDNETVREYYQTLNALYKKNVLVTEMDYQKIDDMDDQSKVEKIIRQTVKEASRISKGDFAVFIGQGDLSDKIKNTDDVYMVREKTRNETDFGNAVAISASSSQAETAMDFLSLCYSDAAFADLLVYGKEGEKYEVKDGVIEPANENNSGIFDWNMQLYNTYGINTVYHYEMEAPAQWEYPAENDPIKNYKGIDTYDSAYTGKLFDISGYESVCRKLIEKEKKYLYTIYKAEDFDTSYNDVLKQFDRKEYQNFVKYMNKQK